MTPVCTDSYRKLQGIWVVCNSHTLKLVFDTYFKNTEENNVNSLDSITNGHSSGNFMNYVGVTGYIL